MHRIPPNKAGAHTKGGGASERAEKEARQPGAQIPAIPHRRLSRHSDKVPRADRAHAGARPAGRHRRHAPLRRPRWLRPGRDLVPEGRGREPHDHPERGGQPQRNAARLRGLPAQLCRLSAGGVLIYELRDGKFFHYES